MEQTNMMKDIAIFGAGGFGRELACLLNRINEKSPSWRLVGFFDDGVETGTKISHHGEVLGGMDKLNDWPSPLAIAIAIGDPMALKSVRERIVNPNLFFPNIIHPDFLIADEQSFTIGQGNIIQGGCSASCDVTIGDFNVFNGSICMGHDDKIGNYNVLMPSIIVSGEVTIGEGNLIGVGSIILQQIKIGNNVRLGAGAVLMTKPKDGNTYIGNPAKKFNY